MGASPPEAARTLALLPLLAYGLFRCTIYLIPSGEVLFGSPSTGGFGSSADLCQSAGQCLGLGLLLWFASRRRELRLVPLAAATILAYVATAAVIILADLSQAPGVVSALIWLVHGMARGVAFVLLIEPFACYPRREAFVALAMCLVIHNSLVLIIGELSTGIPLAVCVICLPLAALAMLLWQYRLRGNPSKSGQLEGGVARERVPHIANCVFVLVCVVMFARSFVNLATGNPSVPRLGADEDTLRAERLFEILIVGVLVVLAFSDDVVRALRGRLFCLPIVAIAITMAAGLALVPFAGDTWAFTPTFLTNLAGSMLIFCVFWMIIEAWPSHPMGIVALLCVGRLAFKAGTLACDAIGFALESSGTSWPLSSATTSVIALFVLFVATIPVLVRGVETGALGPLRDGDGQGTGEQGHADAAMSLSELRERDLKEYATAQGLSAREAEVYVLLMEGRSYPFVAERLSISPGTVSTHVDRIYKKLGVHGRQELIDLYQEAYHT